MALSPELKRMVSEARSNYPENGLDDDRVSLSLVNRAAEVYGRPLGLSLGDGILIVAPPRLTLRQRLSLLFFG